MDKDRIKGSAEQAKGSLKEAAGKLTGDSKTEAEGKADKAAGKAQNTLNRLLKRQLNKLEKVGGVSVPDLKHFNQVSVKLERFWGDQIRYQLFRYQL